MMISHIQLSQFRITLITTLIMSALLSLFLVYNSANIQWQFIQKKADLLQGFAERSLSREQTNPQLYMGGDGVILGDDRMQFVSSYQYLATSLLDAPDEEELIKSKVNLFIQDFKGVLTASEFVLIYSIKYQDKQFYAYFHNNTEYNSQELSRLLVNKMQTAIFTAVIGIILLFIWQLYQSMKVGNMLDELAHWADNISTGKKIKPPSFVQAPGMKHLTHTMSNSLNTFSHILEQEHTFAKFSSHELRAHIATLSANMEILELIMQDLKPDERKVLNRMVTAVEDMKYQTESLLWMSKIKEKNLEKTECIVSDIATKAIENNQTYLKVEQVTLTLHKGPLSWYSHPILLQIAINNLVRNAFQNTTQGAISITIDEYSIEITNQNDQPSEQFNTEGFGIGLVMVSRILETLELSIQTEDKDNGKTVKVFA